MQAAGGAEAGLAGGNLWAPQQGARPGTLPLGKAWGTEAAGLGEVVIWCVVQETWAPLDGPLLQASAFCSVPGTREVPRTQKLNPGGKEDNHGVGIPPCVLPALLVTVKLTGHGRAYCSEE